MMKLSRESKVRLGVGIGAFVLIIGLVFGVSRTLIHFAVSYTHLTLPTICSV